MGTAWGFATTGQLDEALFAALARAAEPRLGDFTGQNLANTAWAFATADQPFSAPLDAIAVLDALDAQGHKPQAIHYSMSVQGVAVLGQMEAALVLLIRSEADGLPSQSDETYYPSFHTLLEGGRESSGCGIAVRVQAVVHRLGLIA